MEQRTEFGLRAQLWEKQQSARVYARILPDPAYPLCGVPVGSAGYQVHLRLGNEELVQLLALGQDDLPALIEVLQGALAFITERRAQP
jgi:hypothetical protein